MYASATGRADVLKGFTLFLVLLISIGFSIFLSLDSPTILGTELNANGTVEYLCIGRGCENLNNMDF